MSFSSWAQAGEDQPGPSSLYRECRLWMPWWRWSSNDVFSDARGSAAYLSHAPRFDGVHSWKPIWAWLNVLE
jgi:hypothetical protein